MLSRVVQFKFELAGKFLRDKAFNVDKYVPIHHQLLLSYTFSDFKHNFRPYQNH